MATSAAESALDPVDDVAVAVRAKRRRLVHSEDAMRVRFAHANAADVLGALAAAAAVSSEVTLDFHADRLVACAIASGGSAYFEVLMPATAFSEYVRADASQFSVAIVHAQFKECVRLATGRSLVAYVVVEDAVTKFVTRLADADVEHSRVLTTIDVHVSQADLHAHVFRVHVTFTAGLLAKVLGDAVKANEGLVSFALDDERTSLVIRTWATVVSGSGRTSETYVRARGVDGVAAYDDAVVSVVMYQCASFDAVIKVLAFATDVVCAIDNTNMLRFTATLQTGGTCTAYIAARHSE